MKILHSFLGDNDFVLWKVYVQQKDLSISVSDNDEVL